MRKTDCFVFFFGKDDFLSNWHPARFTVNGVTFTCLEQYMMYSKAMLFGCTDIAELVLGTSDPKAQKALGRQVRNFDAAVWDAKRMNIVTAGCREKFAQNPQLLDLLVATGTRQLVEASPYDRIWGIGLRESDPRANNPALWLGQNLLGQALMAARQILDACHQGGVKTSLLPYKTGMGSTAWRATEFDAPGLYALISDGHGLAIPRAPETEDLTIAIFYEGVQETLGSVVIDGRAGMNRWYLQNIGYKPDEGPEGPLSIMQLIDQVAGHLLLRHFEQGICPNAE